MDIIELAKQYHEAWNSHDADKIASFFSSDGTYNDPSAGKGQNAGAIKKYAQMMFKAFPDLYYDPVSTAQTDDDKVVLEYMITGTNKGELPGSAPTCRRVFIPAVDIIKFKGDKIFLVTGYFDRMTMAEQLGWVEG